MTTSAIKSLLGVATAALTIAATTGVARSSEPDGYVGIVEQSDRMKRGERIVLGNLRGGIPIVVWPGGNAEPTTRMFQDDEYVVLVFVAKLTGGTETFYVDIKARRFTLIEATFPTVLDQGFQPGVTQGRLVTQ
jgi:hypothetical protein